MTLARLLGGALAAGLVAACAAEPETSATPAPPTSEEDERGSVGVPPPAGDYCKALGFTLEGEQCRFPDGTSCEQWSFYRGECGQQHSYCQQHGGTIASKTEDMGGWTAVYGECTVDGKTCKESSFFQSGKCL